MTDSHDFGIFIFIGTCVALVGAASIRFRREFVGFLVSVPGTWAYALSEGSRRRLEWFVLGLGVVFVLGGVLFITLGARSL